MSSERRPFIFSEGPGTMDDMFFRSNTNQHTNKE